MKDLEWRLMWLRGLEPPEIARATGSLAHLVRRFVTQLTETNPQLWERRLLQHDRPALPRHEPGTLGAGWRRWLWELNRFANRNGRMPAQVGPVDAQSALELALALWVQEQRRAERRDDLTTVQLRGLEAVPGWRKVPPLSGRETRWRERLAECTAWTATTGRRPSYIHGGTDTERSLGAWVDTQRQKHREGRLSEDHVARLDAELPAWRPTRSNRLDRRWNGEPAADGGIIGS